MKSKCKLITVFNQKGGCGKTTTVKNLGGCLAAKGYKTLLVDCDESANCTTGIAYEQTPEMDLAQNLIDFVENCEIDDDNMQSSIVPTCFKNLYLMPASKNSMHIANRTLATQASLSMVAFKKLFPCVIEDFDYILFDVPATFGTPIAENCLIYADYFLIPLQANTDSISGLFDSLNKLKHIKMISEKTINILGCLLVDYDAKKAMSESAYSALKNKLGDKLIDIVIRHSNEIDNATQEKKPLIFYKPKSNPALDYEELADYVIKQCEGE